jgi:hypothetical protein
MMGGGLNPYYGGDFLIAQVQTPDTYVGGSSGFVIIDLVKSCWEFGDVGGFSFL